MLRSLLKIAEIFLLSGVDIVNRIYMVAAWRYEIYLVHETIYNITLTGNLKVKAIGRR